MLVYADVLTPQCPISKVAGGWMYRHDCLDVLCNIRVNCPRKCHCVRCRGGPPIRRWRLESPRSCSAAMSPSCSRPPTPTSSACLTRSAVLASCAVHVFPSLQPSAPACCCVHASSMTVLFLHQYRCGQNLCSALKSSVAVAWPPQPC